LLIESLINITFKAVGLVNLMNKPSKLDRHCFLLNTGILAAGWELSRADTVLSQELTPTPFCHDGDESCSE
jgi:hypothetical protein